ncbi:glycerate kinase [Nostoc sp. FACHB-152]|uniref:glycerate kinase n=1 Tax=unclassified Nostoc TaxID=2593658 RepID=UPI001686CA8D|nr:MULTISPECIES: glycerate kinase [unclassified Nostoc]MBD2448203.1 glycerate kinase [Nostoc sp. FACHB-152]MBD2469223.1 glycerate kinase [Nostoc sp. FACHB-145]
MHSWLSAIIAEDVRELTWQQARAAALADILKAKAFGITPTNVDEIIQARSHLLKSVLPAFSQLCQTSLRHANFEEMLVLLWELWLPLGMKLAAHRQQLNRPLIQGILGVQGTGKTTMCQVLSLILQQLGYRTLSWSLDDLYKTYSDRLALLQQDPRLIWRGPPGTHDIELGLNVLNQIRQGATCVTVPRFDKSAHEGAGDRTDPEIITNVDIVLFEGWFVGVRPIDPNAFDLAPPPIITDADKTFARDLNYQLGNYLPLWEQLDSLILLYPIDYRSSLEWRKQAEQQMVGAGKSGMSNTQIEEFVNYFWRSLHPELFLKPLLRSSSIVDLVIEICPDRTFGKIYDL